MQRTTCGRPTHETCHLATPVGCHRAVLVKNDSPIQLLRGSEGKRVATTRGSIQDPRIKNCFPDTSVAVADSFTNALLAFKPGPRRRIDVGANVLVGVAAADRSAKLTNDLFLE